MGPAVITWSDYNYHITVSIRVIPSDFEEHPESYLLTNNWTPFDSRDKEIVREVMDNIEEFTNLNLVEVSYGGDIRFNKVDMDMEQMDLLCFQCQSQTLSVVMSGLTIIIGRVVRRKW